MTGILFGRKKMNKKKVYLWFQAALCILLGVLLVSGAVDLYLKGIRNAGTGGVMTWMYTREAVIKKLSVAAPVFLALVLSTVVGSITGLLKKENPGPAKPRKITNGRSSVKNTEKNLEAGVGKSFEAVAGKNIEEGTGRTFEETAGNNLETSAEKNAAKRTTLKSAEEEKGGGLFGKTSFLNIVRICILACAIFLILHGIRNGSMKDVLVKASNICTECIGFG